MKYLFSLVLLSWSALHSIAQNVGINIAAPTERLHINGNILLADGASLFIADKPEQSLKGLRLHYSEAASIGVLDIGALDDFQMRRFGLITSNNVKMMHFTRYFLNNVYQEDRLGIFLPPNQAPRATVDINGSVLLKNGSSVFIGGITDAGQNGGRFHNNGSTNYYDCRGSSVEAHFFRGDNVNGGTPLMLIRNNGIVSAFSFVSTSDERTKNAIHEISHGLSTVMQLRPVQYLQTLPPALKDGKLLINKAEASTPALGFSAQELFKVVPEAVYKPADETAETWGVHYHTLIPVLTKAIQEQQKQIMAQQAQMEQLRLELNELKRQQR